MPRGRRFKSRSFSSFAVCLGRWVHSKRHLGVVRIILGPSAPRQFNRGVPGVTRFIRRAPPFHAGSLSLFGGYLGRSVHSRGAYWRLGKFGVVRLI